MVDLNGHEAGNGGHSQVKPTALRTLLYSERGDVTIVVRRCGSVEREPAGDFGVYEHVEVLCGFLPSRFSSSGHPCSSHNRLIQIFPVNGGLIQPRCKNTRYETRFSRSAIVRSEGPRCVRHPPGIEVRRL